MTKNILKASVREVTGKKMRALRGNGKIPAVVYGHGVLPRLLWLSATEFQKLYQSAGESSVIELVTEGEKSVNVLVHDTQADPISGVFSHIDLLQIRMDEEIEAHIPLEFVGEAPAVKALGGMLLKNIDEIEVSCLPSNLPPVVSVDVSALETFDHHITVGDLKVDSTVKVLTDPELIVAGVTPPRTEAEVASLEEKVDADVTKVEGVVKENSEKTSQAKE